MPRDGASAFDVANRAGHLTDFLTGRFVVLSADHTLKTFDIGAQSLKGVRTCNDRTQFLHRLVSLIDGPAILSAGVGLGFLKLDEGFVVGVPVRWDLCLKLFDGRRLTINCLAQLLPLRLRQLAVALELRGQVLDVFAIAAHVAFKRAHLDVQRAIAGCGRLNGSRRRVDRRDALKHLVGPVEAALEVALQVIGKIAEIEPARAGYRGRDLRAVGLVLLELVLLDARLQARVARRRCSLAQ
jgi:hypothetical protein